jgi:hypothetical protein
LILIGLIASIWPSGGRPYDWYFLVYETMFLLWPWDFELRFLLPVAPLACLYGWRGGTIALGWIAGGRRRRCAAIASASAVLGAIALAHAWSGRDQQALAAAVLFTLLALPLAVASFRDTARLAAFVQSGSLRWTAIAGCVLLLVIAVPRDAAVARVNRSFTMSPDVDVPQIQAARWLRDHTPADAVVMARQLDVVYHYAERKVVWFPPTADTQVLMDGIAKHHVDFIVIIARGGDTYWRPAEETAFAGLLEQYPGRFATVQRGRRETIYAVARGPQDDSDEESN